MGEDGAWTGDSVGAWRDGGFGFHDYERMECRGRGETRPPAPIPARADRNMVDFLEHSFANTAATSNLDFVPVAFQPFCRTCFSKTRTGRITGIPSVWNLAYCRPLRLAGDPVCESHQQLSFGSPTNTTPRPISLPRRHHCSHR
jgi:hypothetical protein